MRSKYILFKTKNSNYYLYSFAKNQILLLNPPLYQLLLMHKSGKDLNAWIKSIKSKTKLDDSKEYSKHEIIYQFNKYLFLLNNGYFEEPILNKFKYTGDDINYFISNTRQVTFEVTERCNLSCDYCVYGKYYTNRKSLDKNLSVKSAKTTLDFLFKRWSSSFNSSYDRKISIGFYGGEPLLCYEFVYEIVDYVKRFPLFAQNMIEFSMTTNGVVLDHYIPFLVENKFNLLISLDGGTEFNNSYRKFKNKTSAYNIIISNILNIKNKYPEYFEKFVRFNSVLHNRNSINDITKFFKNNFNKVPNISELATDSINPEYKDEFLDFFKRDEPINKIQNRKKISNQEERIEIKFERLVKFFGAYSGFSKENYLDLLINKKEKLYVPTATCKPFTRMVFITAEGKILPCERIGHEYVLGCVDDEKLHINYNEIANDINSHLDTIYDKYCNRCVFQFQCNTCVFHTNIGSEKFHCGEFKKYSESKMEEMFADHISVLEEKPETYLKITKFKFI
jgi:uncharacterized protein